MSDLLSEEDVVATIFATHLSEALATLDRDRFEIGVHPAYPQGASHNPDLARLCSYYGDVKGGRSHALAVSAHVLTDYQRHGLVYESNVFLPFHANLQPVERRPGFFSLPFFWSDDFALDMGIGFDTRKRLTLPGLKIFNFHPVHVFANTFSHGHYRDLVKPAYQDDEQMSEVRNTTQFGVEDALRSVIEEGREQGFEFARTADIVLGLDSTLHREDARPDFRP